MNSKLLSLVKFLFLIAIAFGFLAYAFRNVSIVNIIAEILQADLFWVLFSAFFSVLAFVSRAYRWNLLIESSGYSSPLNKTAYSLMVGYFANLAFPRLGEVTRCGALSKAESIPFNVLLGTVIVERVIDVVSLLICLLLACIFEFKRLGNFLLKNIVDPILKNFNQFIESPVSIIILVALVIITIFIVRYLSNKKKQSGKDSIATLFIKGLINGLKSARKLKRPWVFIFHSILIWLLYFLSVYVCFYAFPFTSSLGLNAALFLLVAGGFATSTPVQGGIGVYHLFVSHGLVLYGLSQQKGLAFATLIHTTSLAMIVILGSVSLLLLFLGKKYKPALELE